MANQGASTQRPNLLYIHSDQHNPAVTGCYGDPIGANAAFGWVGSARGCI